MADRVFPLSSYNADHREELHRKAFTGAPAAASLPPAGYRPESCGRPRCGCCCFITTGVAGFFIILIAAGAALYLALQPKLPTFSIRRAHITQFTLSAEPARRQSQRSPSAAALHLNMNLSILSENTNKKIGIHYEQVSVELVYGRRGGGGGQVIGRGALEHGFYVGPRQREQVELQVKGQDMALEEKVGVGLDEALRGRAGDGVWMQVAATARLRIRAWSVRSRSVRVHIGCDVHMSRPIPHADAHLLSKSCKFKSLSL